MKWISWISILWTWAYKVKRVEETVKNVFNLTGLTWEDAQEYARKGSRITYVEWPKDEGVICINGELYRVRQQVIMGKYEPTETEKISCGWAVIPEK